MPHDSIRVLLADDHFVVRAGLRLLIGTAPDITVVGEASTGREAVALAARQQPDVVVMDLSMAELDGLAATAQVRALRPAPRVLVLTMHAESEYVHRALRAGASGYVVKTAADRELLAAIRTVARGETHVPPSVSTDLTALPLPDERLDLRRAQYARLTERERMVLRLVAEGFSGPQIGVRLAISAKTVDTYRQRIASKTGLAQRSEYVRMALALGLMA